MNSLTRIIFKIFLLLVLISGCSGLQTKRDVMPDNTFVSNNPNLSINVSPEFKYIGNPTDKGFSTSVGGRKLRNSFDSYCFVETDNNMVKRSVTIQIHTTETYFVSDFFRNEKYSVAKGTTKCGGKSFQYFTRDYRPAMNDHITRHIADQGYTMGYGIIKVFGRVYGAKGNTLVKIFYYESLGDSRFDYNFLSQFDKRADLSFDFEYDAEEKVQNIIALSGGEELKGADSKDAGKQVQQAAKEAEQTEAAPKMAAIPEDAPIIRVSLRREPMEILNQAQIRGMLVKYNFFDMTKHPQGTFVNDFADNNDGTITDKATGLMWQQSGSSTRMSNQGANIYLERSNEEQFAGYSDWRMPTVEELASLLTRSTQGGLHIDPLFDDKQIHCWTIDPCDPTYSHLQGSWIIDFQNGEVSQAFFRGRVKGPAAYSKNPENYVKAVRSVK